jgi:hypothetical protein
LVVVGLIHRIKDHPDLLLFLERGQLLILLQQAELLLRLAGALVDLLVMRHRGVAAVAVED